MPGWMALSSVISRMKVPSIAGAGAGRFTSSWLAEDEDPARIVGAAGQLADDDDLLAHGQGGQIGWVAALLDDGRVGQLPGPGRTVGRLDGHGTRRDALDR